MLCILVNRDSPKNESIENQLQVFDPVLKLRAYQKNHLKHHNPFKISQNTSNAKKMHKLLPCHGFKPLLWVWLAVQFHDRPEDPTFQVNEPFKKPVGDLLDKWMRSESCRFSGGVASCCFTFLSEEEPTKMIEHLFLEACLQGNIANAKSPFKG